MASEKEVEESAPIDRLLGEIGELKKNVPSLLKRMESALRQAAETADGFTAKVAALEAQFKEKEASLQAKDSSLSELSEKLRAQVQDLEGQVKEKEKLVEHRDTELKEIQSKMAALHHYMTQMESRVKEAEQAATDKEGLTTKILELQNQLKEKGTFVATRELELKNLQIKINLLVKRLQRMESLIKQAGALASGEAEEEEKTGPSTSRANRAGADKQSIREHLQQRTDITKHQPAVQVATETVPSRTLERMVRVLTEAMGPMASVVVQNQIAALGESPGAFPKNRFQELVDAVTEEILNGALKFQFQEQMAEELERGAEREEGHEEPSPRTKESSSIRKASDSEDAHESLTAEIYDLERRIKEREDFLKSREADAEKQGQDQELEHLRLELHEKKIRLAEIERHDWRSEESSWTWKKIFTKLMVPR